MVHKVICVNHGTKYPPIYVETLQAMVERNLTLPHEFICFTDCPENYDCKTIKLPDGYSSWWNKVCIFQSGLFGKDDKVLYLDLDIVITGNIDFLFEHEGFTAMKDYLHDAYNSSVMLLGYNPEIFEECTQEVMESFVGDQDWITHKIPYRQYFSDELVRSYRHTCSLGVPEGCRIVVFHGFPKPHEYPANWVGKFWKL